MTPAKTPKKTAAKAPRKAVKGATSARATAKSAQRPASRKTPAKRAPAPTAGRMKHAAKAAPRARRARPAAPLATTAAAPPAAPPAAPFTVFLDRDGVLNENPRIQVRRWAGFRWLPGAPEALALLNRPDVQACLVTNQPATGLGYTTPRAIHRLHAQMLEEVHAAGGRIDRIEVCFAPPFWPARRRKPRPGMIEDGAAAFELGPGFDPARAVMVGDKLKDARAAAAFGIPCILLATTLDADRLERGAARADVPYLAIVDGLPAAVDLILGFVAEAQP